MAAVELFKELCMQLFKKTTWGVTGCITWIRQLYWKSLPKNTGSSKHMLKVAKSCNKWSWIVWRSLRHCITALTTCLCCDVWKRNCGLCKLYFNSGLRMCLPSSLLLQMQEKCVPQNEVKAVLLLNNASAHPAGYELRCNDGRIRIECLLPYTCL